MDWLEMLQSGLGFGDLALAINRTALGTFFAISGYHKLFNPTRHASVITTFKNLHIPFIGFNQWFVPCVEFFGGLALITGILAPLAAMGLLIICFVATCTDGLKRIVTYSPIDMCDYLDDVLYLPEVLYVVGLIVVIGMGPGAFTFGELL